MNCSDWYATWKVTPGAIIGVWPPCISNNRTLCPSYYFYWHCGFCIQRVCRRENSKKYTNAGPPAILLVFCLTTSGTLFIRWRTSWSLQKNLGQLWMLPNADFKEVNQHISFCSAGLRAAVWPVCELVDVCRLGCGHLVTFSAVFIRLCRHLRSVAVVLLYHTVTQPSVVIPSTTSVIGSKVFYNDTGLCGARVFHRKS